MKFATVKRRHRWHPIRSQTARQNKIDLPKKQLETQAWTNENDPFPALNDDASLPKVYAFITFLYTQSRKDGYSSVSRWTRKVDIFANDLLLIPIHDSDINHWRLAIVDFVEKKIDHFDSLHYGDRGVLEQIQKYLRAESKAKKNVDFNFDGWSFNDRNDCPEQKNNSDCGVFVTHVAEYCSRRAPLTFTQDNMDYFRRQMVFEIVSLKLMDTVPVVLATTSAPSTARSSSGLNTAEEVSETGNQEQSSAPTTPRAGHNVDEATFASKSSSTDVSPAHLVAKPQKEKVTVPSETVRAERSPTTNTDPLEPVPEELTPAAQWKAANEENKLVKSQLQAKQTKKLRKEAKKLKKKKQDGTVQTASTLEEMPKEVRESTITEVSKENWATQNAHQQEEVIPNISAASPANDATTDEWRDLEREVEPLFLDHNGASNEPNNEVKFSMQGQRFRRRKERREAQIAPHRTP